MPVYGEGFVLSDGEALQIISTDDKLAEVIRPYLTGDDVANDQRKVIYEQRNRLMDVEDISESITAIRHDVVNEIVSQFIPPASLEELWDAKGLEEHLEREFGLRLAIGEWLQQEAGLDEERLRARIVEAFDRMHAEAGRLQISPTVPICCSSALCRMTIRSHSDTASAWSWVT